ncbi:MAG: hypothetical protein FJ106_10560 [Deltaproteobacteria bacterium]|nr:hypothetical protein [Deltaproteobacteria bacterium]
MEAFLDQVEQEGLLASAKPLKIHLPDPDDEPFLAEAVITGNKRHCPKKQYEGVKILSPAEFLEVMKEKI